MTNVASVSNDDDIKDLAAALRAFSRPPAETVKLITRQQAAKRSRSERKATPEKA